MKQWKLVLVALLSLLLVCTCMSAMADACTHVKPDGTTAYAWSVKTAATCTEAGVQEYKCTLCGNVASTTGITKLGHEADGNWQITLAPTCNVAGTRVQKCTRCTENAKSEAIPATGHNTVGVPFTVKAAATCKDAGVEGQLCANGCGTWCNTRAIPKLTADAAHNWVSIDKAVAATCTTEGKTEKFQCTICSTYKGGTVVKAAGHKAGVWTDEPAATCTKAGKQVVRCTVCNTIIQDKVVSAKGHTPLSEAAWVVTKAATCTEEGSRHKLCKVCDIELVKEAIAKTAHNVTGSPWVQTKEPSCKETGLETRECIVCGGVGESRTIAKTACLPIDIIEIDAAVAATHTTDGKTARTQCTKCGTYYGGKVIAKLGHDKNVAWTDDPANVATCTKAGRKIKVCSCGVILDSKTQSAYGHKSSDWIVDTAATCTATGTRHKECTVATCKAILVKETIAKKAHDVTGSPWTLTTAPTCAKEGIETRECIVCGGVGESRKVAKTACDKTKLVEIDAAVAMTCETNGKTATMQCPTCKAITGGTVIKASGHKTTDEVTTKPTCTTDGVKRVLCSNAWCNKGGIVSTNVKIPAAGHKGEWRVTKKATPTEDGLSLKICKVCGFEMDRKVVKYSEMLLNNTITAAGPCTRDLIGGTDWYRVTPIDLSVEGTFTYPLIASNKYTVGTMTVVISGGTLTVSYKLNASQIKVNSEALLIYPNLDALKNPTPATTAGYTIGAPIEIAKTFGEDTKVMLSLYLKADYNAIGAGVNDFKVDNAQVEAMKALID